MSASHGPEQAMDSPRIWPKPPLVLLLFAFAGIGLEQIAPLSGKLFRADPVSIFGGAVLMLCGLGIAAIAVRTLLRADTTYLPDRGARHLVETGVFSRSRNPIYLGFVVMLVGFAVMAGSIWVLLLTPLFMLYLRYFVIAREEAYLERRFGEAYLAYKRKVRRWF